MKKEQTEKNKEALAQVESESLLERTVELKKVIEKQDAKKTKKKETKKAKVSKKRDVTAFNIQTVKRDALSKTEKRQYMSIDAEDSESVKLFLDKAKKMHVTVYKNSKTNKYERLTTDIATKLIKRFMKKNKTYRTRDFQQQFKTASSSYTDMLRSACKRLQKQKFLRIDLIAENERTRAKYEYTRI